MRMWLVPPQLMCDQHLLGEHLEMHMFIGTIRKNISVDGYIAKKLLDPGKIVQRHQELVDEMSARGMNHKSPLEFEPDRHYPNLDNIDIEENKRELQRRCSTCTRRMLVRSAKISSINRIKRNEGDEDG